MSFVTSAACVRPAECASTSPRERETARPGPRAVSL